MSCEHMNLTVRQEELGIHNALASIHSKVQCTEERQEADSVERLHRPQQRELVKLTVQRGWVRSTDLEQHKLDVMLKEAVFPMR